MNTNTTEKRRSIRGRPRAGTDARSRFWSNVKIAEPDECWHWHGCPVKGGYGTVHINGKQTRAHCAAWELTFGPIPEALCVLHKCDNPACVNPNHLFLGTNTDNMADKVAKGRQARGESLSASMRDYWQARRDRQGAGRDAASGGTP